jgi:CDP-diglyceride synthetase
VVTGVFWVITPPLLAFLGTAEWFRIRRAPVGRFVLVAVVGQVVLYLPYFYQSARFVAPAVLMLIVLSAAAIPRLAARGFRLKNAIPVLNRADQNTTVTSDETALSEFESISDHLS